MNRRQKIIVSVTGIFLVLLLLVGLTYAYFLTRINGNENTKSISVSTANLALVYGDGNGILEVGEVLVPGDTVKFKTASGDTVDKKTFSVTNKGNATTDYVVVIDNVSVTYTSTVQIDGVTYTAGDTTTFESNDFVYTLTCTSGCNGVDTLTTFPIEGGILVGNSIDIGEEQTYELSMTYLETGVDQSNDMNKTLTARVNIKDISTINPYSDNTNTLAYNIINNAMLNKNGTELLANPKTKVAEEISKGSGEYEYVEKTFSTSYFSLGYSSWLYAETEAEAATGERCSSYANCVGMYIYDSWPSSIITEVFYLKSYDETTNTITVEVKAEINSELSISNDDSGISYYYRGNTKDNYVNFAGMCWRIVRIDGDGNTKLILEDQYTTCDDNETITSTAKYTGNWAIGNGNFGYDNTTYSDHYTANYLEPKTEVSSSMVKAFYDFQTTKLNDYTSKLKVGGWCYNDTTYDDVLGTNIINKGDYYNGTISGQFYYDSYVRLSGESGIYNPTLKCNGTIIDKFKTITDVSTETDMYVGTLTADEIMYAGGTGDTNNYYYLIGFNPKRFWSLSPSYHDGAVYDLAFSVDMNGILSASFINDNLNSLSFRPSVNLVSGIEIVSGDGTIENPYTIK